jgi:hypothetical protein
MPLPRLRRQKRERPERERQPRPRIEASNSEQSEKNKILDVIDSKGLTKDSNIALPNPTNFQKYLETTDFREYAKTVSVFFYGKVWFYNEILKLLLNNEDWYKSQEVHIVHSMKEVKNSAAKSDGIPKIILPSVHDQSSLNILVSKAFETGSPVWFVGYPSTLAKHLLVSFQCFFLCNTSIHEREILEDVAGIYHQDIGFLEDRKHSVLISKDEARSAHLTF